MQVPLEIRYHQLDSSEAITEEIHRRVAKLEKLYSRLVACRVSVEAPHRQHQTGNIYDVHIELSVPGRDIVVTNEPHRPKQRYANPDLRTVLRDTFKAAERRLKEFSERQRGETKTHDVLFQGTVTQLAPEQDHGFLMTNTGSQLYFNRTSVMNDGFDDLKVGDAVHYIEIVGDTGPIASKVWRGPDHHLD